MKKGFTLLEMLNAVAVLALVIAGVGSAFVGILRMSRTAMTEAEMAVRMRMFREKLLFRVEPSRDGRMFAGLLTAGRFSDPGQVVRASGEGYDTSTGGKVAQTIRVTVDPADRTFRNEGEGPAGAERNRIWLNPTGIPIVSGASGGIDDSVLADKRLYSIGFEASASGVTRRERVVIPDFGYEQVKNTESVFHD